MVITHKFDMAVDRRGPAPIVDAVQGDTNTREIQVSLFTTPAPNQKEAWTIPVGTRVLVRFRKRDGTGGVYDTLPDGSAAVSYSENTIRALLAPQVLSVDGLVLAQIELNNGEDTLGTFVFNVFVEADPSVGTMESEEYINLSNYVAKEIERILGSSSFPGKLPNPEAMTIEEVSYDGSVKVDMTEAVAAVVERKMMSVKRAGAKGDGSTDDTAAFQKAMSESRVVYVPGGTYKLSDTLVIKENSGLILSQDTVLKFLQTEGNCIEMRGSATLRGNHGILWAAYGLTGHVIDMDTLKDGTDHASIPPYAKADPQWKRQRFVYDVNIIKPNSSGFNRTTDGTCNGTAIYMSATNVSNDSTDIPFMWGITMSGIRIAGGFSYGIRAVNYDSEDGYTDDAWNHDMRIEAVIEGCEIGVSLENCNGAYLDVVVQPTKATDGTGYAKHGFYLSDSRYVDMMRCRVWDWQNDGLTLWENGGMYQHIALIGNCRGLLLGDYNCTEAAAYPIRDLIYTDTPSNFDTMTILQEPSNKNFKSIDNVPYFNNGTTDRKLMLATDKFTAEQAEFIHPADGYYTYEDNFTNLVNGYTDGVYISGSGTAAKAGYVTTDFIPIDGAAVHTYRIGGEGIKFKGNDEWGYPLECRIAWYDANKTLKGSVMPQKNIGTSQYYPQWVEDETVAAAFVTNADVAPPIGAAFFRVTAYGKGENLKITIDEKQDYTAIWHGEPKRLDDSIHAKNDWNAAKGEVGYIDNKPFGSEIAEILPETTVEIDPEIGSGAIPGEFTFVGGKEYTVKYNGVEYVTSCLAMEGVFALGNLAAIDESLPITAEPFCLLYDDMGDGIMGLIVGAFDGSASVTLSVTYVNLQKLEEKFLPNAALPFWVDFYDYNGRYETTVTMQELYNAHKNGRIIMARANNGVNTSQTIYPLAYFQCDGISMLNAEFNSIRIYNLEVSVDKLQCLWNLGDSAISCEHTHITIAKA